MSNLVTKAKDKREQLSRTSAIYIELYQYVDGFSILVGRNPSSKTFCQTASVDS